VDEADIRQFLLLHPGDAAEHPGTDLVTGAGDAHGTQEGEAAAIAHEDPSLADLVFVGLKTGFFGQFPGDAAQEIEGAVVLTVGWIGRSGREVRLPGVRGVRAHDAEEEGAIVGAQRAHGEAVRDARVGKTVPLGVEETGKARLEADGAAAIALNRDIGEHEDRAVEHLGLLGRGCPPEGVDLTRVGLRPGPVALDAADVEGCDARDRWLAHRCSSPSLTITAPPPISADARAPFRMTICRAMSLGRPIS
jgi:hypothetical protein